RHPERVLARRYGRGGLGHRRTIAGRRNRARWRGVLPHGRMPRITAMAGKRPPGAKREVGAPVPKDEIDPELVSLRGPRAKVGAITALAIVVVCGVYLIRLFGDFAFARQDKPRDVKIADVLAGDVSTSDLVELRAQVERGAAVRVRTGAGDPGQRVAP